MPLTGSLESLLDILFKNIKDISLVVLVVILLKDLHILSLVAIVFEDLEIVPLIVLVVILLKDLGILFLVAITFEDLEVIPLIAIELKNVEVILLAVITLDFDNNSLLAIFYGY